MINRIVLVGRTTKDIELKKTSSGKSVCRFTVACDAGKDKTDFVPVIAWDQTAENTARYVHKGNLIGVEGRVTTYSTGEGNSRTWHTEVVANSVKFLEPKKAMATNPVANPVEYTPSPDDVVDSSDLPF